MEPAVATGPLGALSHDELGVIVDGLADPLQPVVAVALSSTCLGLRTPLCAALELLKERHERAVALCRKMHRPDEPCSCALLRDANRLDWRGGGCTTDDMTTLGMILRANGLPQLEQLNLAGNYIGDAGMQAICDGIGRGAAPSLRWFALRANEFGPVGAEALAAALFRGAMPNLEMLLPIGNPIGNQGIAALTASLRKMPKLWLLRLESCEIGDEGVASLFANLGKDDFKALQELYLDFNEVSHKSCRTLVSVINEGGLPAFEEVEFVVVDDNPADAVRAGEIEMAVRDALKARTGRE